MRIPCVSTCVSSLLSGQYWKTEAPDYLSRLMTVKVNCRNPSHDGNDLFNWVQPPPNLCGMHTNHTWTGTPKLLGDRTWGDTKSLPRKRELDRARALDRTPSICSSEQLPSSHSLHSHLSRILSRLESTDVEQFGSLWHMAGFRSPFN